MGDAYSSGWMYIPVKLKKGMNELYVRGQFVTASLEFPTKPILLNTEDATLPSIVLNSGNYNLKGAVVLEAVIRVLQMAFPCTGQYH